MLVALFGLQHSVMARPAFKAWWTWGYLPQPLERSVYVLALERRTVRADGVLAAARRHRLVGRPMAGRWRSRRPRTSAGSCCSWRRS